MCLRLVFILLSCLTLAAALQPAAASDGAMRKVLGFSVDGRSFAFMQSGAQDGSGFPYADVFLIDTTTDTFALPPVHVLVEKDSATREQAEAEAMRRAGPALAARRVEPMGRRIGTIAASRPDDEFFQPEAMKGEPIAAASMALTAAELGVEPKLTLTPIRFDPPRCKDIESGRVVGFALTLARKDRPAFDLHKDAQVPESRFCPRTYGLSEAYLYTPAGGPSVVAVLVEFYAMGFEGPDRRFLAVTGTVAK